MSQMEINNSIDPDPDPHPPPPSESGITDLSSISCSCDDTMSEVEGELEKLMSKEGIPKCMALNVMKMHHKLQRCLLKMQGEYVRKVDELEHSLDKASLKLEVDALTLRQTRQQDEIALLQSQNEQLQSVVNSMSSRRR